MTDLQAAIGSAQMDRAEDIVCERQALAKNYDDAFANLDWLRTPFRSDDYEHGYQSYPCLFMPKEISFSSIEDINTKRNVWMDDLQKSGISTRPATHAVHMLSFYKISSIYGNSKGNYINSIIINFFYFILVIPGLYLMHDPQLSRYWFFILLLIYLLCYSRLYRFKKN